MQLPMYLKAALILFYFVHIVKCIDYDGWLNIQVEHSLNCNGNKFCPRGNIALRSIRSGTAVINQQPLTKNHIDELKLLADEDAFYTLRLSVTSADNKETEFLSSMKAQAFLNSGLSDIINTWVLPSGDVISINFQPHNSSQTFTEESTGQYHINSKFYLRHIDQAPVPDTATYIQKLEREREAREKGEVKDNRSFIAKYWMYIVPIAIFVMVSGATNPEAAPAATR